MTEKQLIANRANGRRSTGPRTAAGKRAVAKNGIAHGIYALSPVIEGVESRRDWTRYRRAMLADLAPEGMLEATLAEMVILTAWRQLRVLRYEAEQIRLQQEGAAEAVSHRIRADADAEDVAAEEVEDIDGRAELANDTKRLVGALVQAGDDASLSADDAETLVWLAHRHLGFPEPFGDYWAQVQPREVWSAGAVREHLRSLAEQRGISLDQLLAAMKEEALREAVRSGRAAREVKRELSEYRREHLLPGAETLDKVMRYEAHLSRCFQRDLHELQRLQAWRRGQPVAAPIAVDVDVANGAESR